MASIIDISDVNDGGGMELLMNTSKKVKSEDISITDLDNLERELNDLGGVSQRDDYRGSRGVSFMDTGGGDDGSVHLNIQDDTSVDIDLGAATSNLGGNSSNTWDDYGKFNDIPSSSNTGRSYFESAGSGSSAPPMSRDEQEREKYRMIRKLEELERKSNGKIQLSKKYTMDSPFNEVKNEYDAIAEEGARKASVKFQGSCLKMLISGIEFLNEKYDPFDVNLAGWGDSIDENLDDYDDIFGELYEKYKSRGSLAPELKLVFQLGTSAFMTNLSNKLFKTSLPGMQDVFQQNPELMRQFQNAAVNTMAQQNPGMGNFMSGLGGQSQNSQPPNPSQQQGRRGPPPPVPTQGQYAEPPPPNRGGNNPRPDLFAARGQNPRDAPQPPSQTPAPPRSGLRPPMMPVQPPNTNAAAMNLALSSTGVASVPQRREMRGPSDMSELLSGIKTRTIDIATAPVSAPSPPSEPTIQTQTAAKDDDDNISQLSNDTGFVSGASGKEKKKRGRKPRSNKNIVSIDL